MSILALIETFLLNLRNNKNGCRQGTAGAARLGEVASPHSKVQVTIHYIKHIKGV
jgi:hypothetical protein